MEDDYQDSFEDQSQSTHTVFILQYINKDTLTKQLRKIYQDIDQKINLINLIKFPAMKEHIAKQVCSKVVSRGDFIVQCYNCRTDNTCIICMQCFKDGNHVGHKFSIKAANGGCCDCGDKEAWKEEGFCKNHSGKFKDFPIQKAVMDYSKRILDELFFLCIYLNAKKTKNRDSYTRSFINLLTKKNTDNIYFNKITFQIIKQKLPLCGCYKLNKQLNNRTILENLLDFHISKQWICQWFQLFMLMFSYYPFKQQLAKCYIRNYGNIMTGDQQSISCANTISCQILTSYQLIQKYSEKNRIGLGQRSPIPPLKHHHQLSEYRIYYTYLLDDLGKIAKLKQGTPLKYWRMHINTDESIDNIFKYYAGLLQLNEKLKKQKMNNLSIIISLLQMSKVQHEAISIMINILHAIKNDLELVKIIILFFWNKCSEVCNNQPQNLFIFRPYQRCLSLAIFTAFQCSFDHLSQKVKNLMKFTLQINKQNKFIELIKKILKKLLCTYLVAARSTTFPGFSSSLHPYLYFYKYQKQNLSSTDMIGIKLFLLILQNLHQQKFIQKQFLNRYFPTNSTKKQNKVQKPQQMQIINQLLFIKYLYTTSIPQIFITYQIDPHITIYNKQIFQLLQRFFCSYKGVISIQKVKILKRKLFLQNMQSVTQWINLNCIIKKQRKQFVYQNYQENNNAIKTLNFTDIWQNNLHPEGIKFSDPFKTKQMIRDNNLKVFNSIWSIQNIKILTQIVKQLIKQSNEYGEKILQKILHIYLIKFNQQQSIQNEQKQTIQKIIQSYMNKIPQQILIKLKQLKINDKILQQNIQHIQVLNQFKQDDRKTKSQKLKQKKLLKFQNIQNKILNNPKVTHHFQIKISHQQPIPSENEQHFQHICPICKNNNEQQLIYLVSIQIRNHQKLLAYSQNGKQCLVFYSCFHTFDEQCIKNHCKYKNILSCPLCKSSADFIMPLKLSPKCHQNYCKKILQCINNIYPKYNQDNKLSISQEIIKSYYHFAILCQLYPINLLSNRINLYKMLMDVIKINKIHLECQKNKFIKGQVQTTSTSNLRKKLSNYSFHNQDKEHSQAMIKCISFPKSQSFYQRFINSFFNFNQQCQRCLNQINQNDETQTKINLFLKIIYGKQISQNDKNRIKNLQQQPKLDSILIKLPHKFSQLGKSQTCIKCSQITSSMIQCLLCPWIGCQQCQAGRSQYHIIESHGGIGVFMMISSSIAFYQSTKGKSNIGPLYQNNWGSKLQSNYHWEQFQLNDYKINLIQQTILHDKPLFYSKLT